MSFESVGKTFFSYAYIVFVGLSSAALFPVALLIRIVSHFLDKRLILLNLFTSFWASLYIWCMPIWSVKIIDRHKMDIKKNYIIVANHQSQLDILLIYRLFFPFRWVSKAEVFMLPFIGWNMFLNGYIRLKRGDKQSVMNMMTQCETLLKQNISIMVFPEGTRSENGIVKPFKPGAFILAKKMKKPLLPLVINNTKDALPKNSLILTGKHEMAIRVLDEIPYEAFKDKKTDEISSVIQNLISSHVKEYLI